MSTRASILIKEEDRERWFYHHIDGYPTLLGFLIGQSLSQSDYIKDEWNVDDIATMLLREDITYGVSATRAKFIENYGLSEDSQFVYIINCPNKTLSCYFHLPNESLLQCERHERLVMYLVYPENGNVKTARETIESSKVDLVGSFIEYLESLERKI